ncbi:glycosyltransferase [Methanospirillum sp.]|uniref:glycosyltransferase n=1 Tax=Methanospirillum sp. TaxID=45200 RepID=UPI0035A14090
MKNILIISYHFLSEEEIGSQRIRGLYRNLPAFGWNPIVITSASSMKTAEEENPNIFPLHSIHPLIKLKNRIEFSENKGLVSEFSERYVPCNSTKKKNLFQKIIIRFTEFLFFPDFSSYWAKYAIMQGEKIISDQKIHLIFSTYGPSGCHMAGSYLSKKYNIPWVADYRDLWCDNPGYSYSKVREKIESSFEKKTLLNSDIITTVSNPLVNLLKQRFKDRHIDCIPNGFDERILSRKGDTDRQFTIVYTGRLYQGKQDPEALFIVLSRFIRREIVDPSYIRIHFFGDNDLWLIQLVNNYNLQDIVTFHGQVKHEEALTAQKSAQILLLLTWNDPAHEGIITGKVYEYLASRRPILAIGHENEKDLKKLLEQTGTGVQITSVEVLEEYLLNAYKEFISTGVVSYSGIDEEILKYSHQEMTRKFVVTFSQVV